MRNERIATINSAVFIRLRTDGLAACRLSYGIKKPFNPAPSSLKWLFILNLNYISYRLFLNASSSSAVAIAANAPSFVVV